MNVFHSERVLGVRVMQCEEREREREREREGEREMGRAVRSFFSLLFSSFSFLFFDITIGLSSIIVEYV
jgi:hypothetical protein